MALFLIPEYYIVLFTLRKVALSNLPTKVVFTLCPHTQRSLLPQDKSRQVGMKYWSQSFNSGIYKRLLILRAFFLSCCIAANVKVRSLKLVLCVINGNSFNVGAFLLSSRHTFMYCLARWKVLTRMPSAEFIMYVLRCLSKPDSAPADVDVASSCIGLKSLGTVIQQRSFCRNGFNETFRECWCGIGNKWVNLGDVTGSGGTLFFKRSKTRGSTMLCNLLYNLVLLLPLYTFALLYKTRICYTRLQV